MHRAEGNREVEPLAPVRAQARVDATGGELAKGRDERAHLCIGVDRGLRLPHPDAVGLLERVPVLECGRERDRDRRDGESGPGEGRTRPQQTEDRGAPDAHEHDRGDMHAADETMEKERLLEREEHREWAEGRPPEIEDEPDREEREREKRRRRAPHHGAGNADREKGRKHRKATVVGQLAGEEPAEDRSGPVRGVLLLQQIWARVQEPALEDVGEPHPRGDCEGERAGRGEAADTRERVRAIESPDEEHGGAHDHHVRVEQVREPEHRQQNDRAAKARAVSQKPPEAGEGHERQMHRPDLRVEAEAAPEVALVVEAVEVVGCDET